jgi:hypothetical protein
MRISLEEILITLDGEFIISPVERSNEILPSNREFTTSRIASALDARKKFSPYRKCRRILA